MTVFVTIPLDRKKNLYYLKLLSFNSFVQKSCI